MSRKGLFITFEGVEGAGKTTQLGYAKKWWHEQGWNVAMTREPGGTILGRSIRQILLHTKEPIAQRTELLLYSADRAQHMAEMVEPALDCGLIVLCDRHADSMTAYQAFGRQLDRQLIEQLNQVATQGRKPDLTIVLDLDPQAGLMRASGRSEPDRLESAGLLFHTRVREGFLTIAREEPHRVRVVDASPAPGVVWQQVEAILSEVYASKFDRTPELSRTETGV